MGQQPDGGVVDVGPAFEAEIFLQFQRRDQIAVFEQMDRCRGAAARSLQTSNHCQIIDVIYIAGHRARFEVDAGDESTLAGVGLETCIGAIGDGEDIGLRYRGDAMRRAELAMIGAATTKT